MQWVPYGPHALLLRFAEGVGEEAFQRSRAIQAELDRHPPTGLVEYVPGFTTMLLRFSPENTVNVEELGRSLAGQFERLAHGKAPEAQLKQIPVVYDGDDLESLAEEKNLPVDELIRLHSEPTYKVYLLGFSPGFPYLGELHPRLHAPRRASPRTRVPAGSVAIGGEHTGIYSVDSPGGWRIIGRTPVKLFDPDQLAVQQSPKDLFFLIPGDRVRFVPTKG